MTENQSTQRLAEVLARIAKLPSSNPEPPQFFASFLQLTVAGTGSGGGAIWLLQPGQGPQIYCHIEMEKAGIQGNQAQQQLVMEALDRCAKEIKPVVLPGSGMEGTSNTSLSSFIFKPIRAGSQVAMVLQLIGRENQTQQEIKAVVGLLEQIVEAAETYLAHRRALVLEDDRKALAQLLKYSEGVHNSLDPQRVIYQLANLGRDAIGCERVAVWVDPAIRRGLIAVSGIDKPDKRAVLLQTIEKLSRYCLKENKPIVGSREQLVELDEENELTPLLMAYFNASQLDRIFLQPLLFDEKRLGVIAAEGFEEQAGANLAGVVSTVAKHGAIALHNALEMASMPLVRPFSKIQRVKADPARRKKWAAAIIAIIAALVAGAFIPWTIQIEADCELRPTTSRLIDAPLDGLQVKEVLRTQGMVQQGEVICRLNDLELKTEQAGLRAQLAEEQARQIERLTSAELEISKKRVTQIQNQIDLLQQQIEKTELKAPIAGMILTPPNEMERLEGITVQRGMSICEIADLNDWQVIMNVPQEEIGWVERGLDERGAREVKFYLAAYPKNRLHTMLQSSDQISQAPQLKEPGNVFVIRLDVSEAELQPIPGLRPGSAGQAKIATCQRPLGYVLLRKVIRFFRITFF